MDPNFALAVIAFVVLGFFILRTFVGKISPALARQLVAAGAKLVDVRTPAEFAGGHIEGATNMPLNELESRAEGLGDKGAPVVLYCRSGARSAHAKRVLEAHGFTQVHDLGAMARWR